MVSSIYFSPSTPIEERVVVCDKLNIVVNDKYFGLPAMVGADGSDCFQQLNENVLAKISGWKENLLSMGGKEFLLKAVAQLYRCFQ
jgi:hypothetical protein